MSAAEHDPWHTPARMAAYAKKTRQGTAPKPVTHPVRADGIDTDINAAGIEYQGTPEALVNAGLALLEWLPGQPGCACVTSLTIAIDGRRAHFRRDVRQRYFALYRWTEAERAEREKAAARERAKEQSSEREPRSAATAKGITLAAIAGIRSNGITFSAHQVGRLSATFALLSSASAEIAQKMAKMKGEGDDSSKLSRAHEDVAQACETLRELLG